MEANDVMRAVGLPMARNLLKAGYAVKGHDIADAARAGSGQAAKNCNNMILGVTMIAVCEAFTLAQGAGGREFSAIVQALETMERVS